MKDIAVSDTRNFVFMGHTGSGKTSIVEALLYKMGINDRLGSVSAGSGMADYTDEEKAKKISIFAKPFNASYKSSTGKAFDMTFTDTPGYLDFYGQVLCAIRSTEIGVVVVDASSGVQVGTHRAWKACEKENIPCSVIITGLDKENTSFEKVMNDIKKHFGDKCVPVTLFNKTSVVDVLGKTVPAGMEAQVEEAKMALSERAAETDDALIEKFLGGEALSQEEISKGIRKAVAGRGLFPVFAVCSLKDIGVTELLEGIGRYFPSPEDCPAKDTEGKPIKAGAKDPFVGFVWRTVNDAFVGQLVFVRVLGGTLKVDMEVMNISKGQKEKIGSLLVVNGKKQIPVQEASSGDIVAIPKLKVTGFGDTLCDASVKVTCPSIKFPSPVMIMAVNAKTQADEDKIGTALSRVADDDPTLKIVRNTETKETLICGFGDVHIDTAVTRMKNRSNVDVALSTPKVPYRETVTAKGEGHHKHKKQSGGRGQYAEVYLKVEPKRADDPDWFVDAVVGGVIPGNYIPAAQKGVVEGMAAGTVAGYPVTDFKATVYDGSYHDVDSSEIAFKIAASKAFRDAMAKSRPVLLEPIMTVKVMIPEQYMGDINGDLNHRRGRILGLQVDEGVQVITAEVPQAELFRYAAELRSMTAGQGTFEMEFCRYDIVPSQVAQKVIAASPNKKKVEEEE